MSEELDRRANGHRDVPFPRRHSEVDLERVTRPLGSILAGVVVGVLFGGLTSGIPWMLHGPARLVAAGVAFGLSLRLFLRVERDQRHMPYTFEEISFASGFAAVHALSLAGALLAA